MLFDHVQSNCISFFSVSLLMYMLASLFYLFYPRSAEDTRETQIQFTLGSFSGVIPPLSACFLSPILPNKGNKAKK